MGLRLLTSLELPDFGRGVTLAIFHSFGISDNSKDRLKSSVMISGIAKKASLKISLDRCSMHDDLLMFIPRHNLIISAKFVLISSSDRFALTPLKFHSLSYCCASLGPISTKKLQSPHCQRPVF